MKIIFFLFTFFTLALFVEAQVNSDKKCIFKYIFDAKSSKIEDASNNMSHAELKGQAKIIATKHGNVLKFNNKNAYVIIPGSGKIQINKGCTIIATVKFSKFGTKGGCKDSHGMMLFKPKSFLFGYNYNKLYFNFRENKKNTFAATLYGMKPLPQNEWVQIAVTVARNEDPVQGKLDYRIQLFQNACPDGSKTVSQITPVTNKNLLDIGKGWGGCWFFNGEIAEIAMYNYPFTPKEIRKQLKSSKYVKIKQKMTHISPVLLKELAKLAKEAKNPTSSWFVKALASIAIAKKSASNYEQAVRILIPVIRDVKNDKDFIKAVNSLKGPFRIASNGYIQLFLSELKGGKTPIPSVRLIEEDRELLGSSPLGWNINYIKGRNYASKYLLKSTDDGVTYHITPELNGNNISIACKWLYNNGNKITINTSIEVKKKRLVFKLLRLSNPNKKIYIHDITFPVISLNEYAQSNRLIYPRHGGIYIKNPVNQGLVRNDIYPSQHLSMQFTAYCDDIRKKGIFLGYLDPFAHTKRLKIKSNSNELVFGWECYPGIPLENKFQEDYIAPGPVALEVFSGNWFDAAQIYKRWLPKAKWYIHKLPRQDTPEWFRNLCVWTLTYSPTLDKQKLMIKESQKFQRYLELPLGVWWNEWYQKDLLWPNYVPQVNTISIVKEINKNKNIYLMPYLDGRLWNIRESDFKSQGKAWAVKGAKGNLHTEKYGKEIYATMCSANSNWQNIILKMFSSAIKCGFNAIYNDQLCCVPYLCYDKSHGHPIASGKTWFDKGYWPFFKKWRKDTRNKVPTVVEYNAEPYLSCTDGFLPWSWVDNNRIPLFMSIYSGKVQFTGRVYDHHGPGSPESFFIKSAEQLINGEQIGWFILSRVSQPSFERLFIKRLAHTRFLLKNYFNKGEMLRPPSFDKSIGTYTTNWGYYGYRPVTTPRVFSSAWKQGKSAVVIMVNPLNEYANITNVFKADDYDFGEKQIRVMSFDEKTGMKTKSIFNGLGKQSLRMKPYSIVLYLICPESQASSFLEKANKIAKTMLRIGKFDAGFSEEKINESFPESLPKSPYIWQNTDSIEKISGATLSKSGHIGHIHKNGCVYYGNFDFCKTSNQIEVEIAVSPDHTGGGMVFRVDNPVTGKVLADFTNLKPTGGWKKFKVLKQKLSANISGNHRIFLIFETSAGMNFKKWRISQSEH